jgi:hypothetical protein
MTKNEFDSSKRCFQRTLAGWVMVVATRTCLFGIPEPASAGVWTLTSAPSNHWVSIAASADGTKIAAAANLPAVSIEGIRPGPIYLSTNSGETWFQSGAPSNRWFSVASSADGNKLVAAGYPFGLVAPGPIYTSQDSGFNWTQSSAPSNRWSCVASSADGSKLAAAIYGGGFILRAIRETLGLKRAPPSRIGTPLLAPQTETSLRR